MGNVLDTIDSSRIDDMDEVIFAVGSKEYEML